MSDRAEPEHREPINGLSIVIPIFNEAGNIVELHRQLAVALAATKLPSETIFVDDGSDDGSYDVIAGLARKDPAVRLVRLRRNFGQTAALKAGICHAAYDVVITMDGDLQNDPADIGRMVELLEQGYDLVHGWRRWRSDRLGRRLPSMLANRIVSRLTGFRVHDLGCTLKAVRRSMLEEVDLVGDMHRFVPVLLHQRGARCIEIEVNHRPRAAGVSKYGMGRATTVLLDMVTIKFLRSQAAHPMRYFGGLGLACFVAAIAFFVATVAMKLGGVDMTGNPLLLASIAATIAGIQLVSLGLLGEMLSRMHSSIGGRPHYSVQSTLNLDEDGAG